MDGNADKPKALYVKIVSKPAQHVTGSGTFQRRLKMDTSHPDSCTVSAAAQLGKSGRLRVTLLARWPRASVARPGAVGFRA